MVVTPLDASRVWRWWWSVWSSLRAVEPIRNRKKHTFMPQNRHLGLFPTTFHYQSYIMTIWRVERVLVVVELEQPPRSYVPVRHEKKWKSKLYRTWGRSQASQVWHYQLAIASAGVYVGTECDCHLTLKLHDLVSINAERSLGRRLWPGTGIKYPGLMASEQPATEISHTPPSFKLVAFLPPSFQTSLPACTSFRKSLWMALIPAVSLVVGLPFLRNKEPY